MERVENRRMRDEGQKKWRKMKEDEEKGWMLKNSVKVKLGV